MSGKKNPFQVINLAKMPLDVVRQRAAMERMKYEKQKEQEVARQEIDKPFYKVLGPRHNMSITEDPSEKLWMGNDNLKENINVKEETVEQPKDFRSTLSFLIKCTILGGIVKWSYDAGVWGTTAETAELTKAISGNLHRISILVSDKFKSNGRVPEHREMGISAEEPVLNVPQVEATPNT